MTRILSTRTLLAAVLALGLMATSVFAQPRVLFLTQNESPAEALEGLVVDEYNQPALRQFILDNPDGFIQEGNNRQRGASWAWGRDGFPGPLGADEIPNFDKLLAAKIAELGLTEAMYVDQGITDRLEAAGYEVVRQGYEPELSLDGTEVEMVQPFSGTLTEEEIAELESYDLIIISNKQGNFQIAERGKEADPNLNVTAVHQWGALETPMLLTNPNMLRADPWGPGLVMTYGFAGGLNTVVPWEPNGKLNDDLNPWAASGEVTTSGPAFAFFPDDPVFDGVPIADDDEINLWETKNFLNALQQFSNNPNFDGAPNMTPLAEFEIGPENGWQHPEEGFIERRYHAIIEYEPGQSVAPEQNPGWAYTLTAPRFYLAAQNTAGAEVLNDAGWQVVSNIMNELTGTAFAGNPHPLFGYTTVRPSGFINTEWLGDVLPFLGNGQVVHREHGVLGVFISGSDLYLYDYALGSFLFTNESVYPSLYLFGEGGGWLFYDEGTTAPRQFFSLSDGSLVEVPVSGG